MDYYFQTKHGDSEQSMNVGYGWTPYQGILQGNGVAPATSVIINSPLLQMLRTAGNWGHFIGPITKEYSHYIGYAYVDTDLLQFDMREENRKRENHMQKMQEAIDRWEGGLKATGGAIVPSKSWVYPIAFHFKEKGSWSYKKCEEINYNFQVKDENKNNHNLRKFEPDKAKVILGAILAPDGNVPYFLINLTSVVCSIL